jgi:hypothetical protein
MACRIAILDEHYEGLIRHFHAQMKGLSVSALKLDGFYQQRDQLRKDLGVTFIHLRSNPQELHLQVREIDADLYLFVPRWSQSDEAVRDGLLRARTELSKPTRPSAPFGGHRKLVLLDTVDQSSSPFFSALQAVDLCVKSQVYVDREHYLKSFAGGFYFTEWLSNEMNFDLDGWHFGSHADPAHLYKIYCGWNFGVSRFYRYASFYSQCVERSWGRRSIDLNTRFPLPDPREKVAWEWYHEYRTYCGLKLQALSTRMKVTGFSRVSKSFYMREMAQCKMVFSPFGWGEVCFRDYEAAASGALLIKPAMDHLQTQPDIFRAGISYVPTRWDLSDLSDVCHYYLSHPDEAEAIAAEGRRRLREYLCNGGFSGQISDIIAELSHSHA